MAFSLIAILTASYGVIWLQGEMITKNWQTISQQDTLQQLEARSQGWENSNEHLWREEASVREDRSGCRLVWGQPEGRLSVEDTGGVLSDDRARTAAFERIRRIADAARRASQRIRTGLQELNQHVLGRYARERQLALASDGLKQTSQQLERTTPAVGDVMRQEKRLERDRKQ